MSEARAKAPLDCTRAGDDVTLARALRSGPQAFGRPWIYPFQQGGRHAEPRRFVLSRYPSLDRVPRGVGTGRRTAQPLGGRPGALAAFRQVLPRPRPPAPEGAARLAATVAAFACRDCPPLRARSGAGLGGDHHCRWHELHFDRRHHRRQQQCARRRLYGGKWWPTRLSLPVLQLPHADRGEQRHRWSHRPAASSPRAITIDGNFSTVTRDSSAPQFRILAVGATGNLTLQFTTVSDGASGGDHGGGINNAGTLTLLDSTVSNNTASVPSDGRGGGISTSGTLTTDQQRRLGQYGRLRRRHRELRHRNTDQQLRQSAIRQMSAAASGTSSARSP